MFHKTLAAALAAAALLAGAAKAETLRFSSFEPPQAFITGTILARWAEDVTAASEGTLNVRMFAGGTLGRSPAQQLELVESGVADLAWIVTGYNPGRFDGSLVAELPFAVTSATSGSVALWKLHEEGLLAGDYDKFKVVGVVTSSPNAVVSTGAIAQPEDLRGRNFRASSPLLLKALEALGAVPVGGITGSNLAESISRGLIFGTFNEWNAIQTFRIDEAAGHVLEVPMGTSTMLVLMNKAKYDGLPEAAKAAIDRHSGLAFSEAFGAAFDANVVDHRAKVVADGKTKVTEPSAEQLQAWRAAVQPVTDGWIEATPNGRAIYDRFIELIAEVDAR
ncbi:TRAP transporter substrate-binding protein [Paracoccus sp. MKU1]|uniref:TRAP transporter substrate-binding protein n=1 Tax=Paracoccus sp. MKU1 TaxID=1745182 RepID=UPI00071919EF|nr:TRAP transporter substrate-binding protein [Paracoccus sp. MKU1]KRW94495.1 C4-dicarboxylate ABC transporter substrate-binding protein [Paracoccus sp. MKU1]